MRHGEGTGSKREVRRTHLGDQLQLKRSIGMRAASYGGGGASTAREDQDSAREGGNGVVRVIELG